MNLRKLKLDADYNKENSDVINEFYIPCMTESNSYDRITGYFSSTIYYICWDAINEFISNNGKMRIVCSPCLSEEDVSAIKEGYELKSKKIIEDGIGDRDLFDTLVMGKMTAFPREIIAKFKFNFLTIN